MPLIGQIEVVVWDDEADRSTMRALLGPQIRHAYIVLGLSAPQIRHQLLRRRRSVVWVYQVLAEQGVTLRASNSYAITDKQIEARRLTMCRLRDERIEQERDERRAARKARKLAKMMGIAP